jgi:hypothetical protein
MRSSILYAHVFSYYNQWGTNTTIIRDIQNAPQTILDAIEATNRLGFGYLWVDRYCINENEKHDVIQRMGDIYRNSSVTLVAVAGDGPEYGLPGVRLGRPSYPQVTIGPWAVNVGKLNVKEAVRVSKWNHRGWYVTKSVCLRN